MAERDSKAGQKGKVSGGPTEAEIEELKGCTKLCGKWAIWEQVQGMEKAQKGQAEKEYMENLRKVAEFDNLITFWQLWNKLPYSSPGNFFTYYDDERQALVQPQYAEVANENIGLKLEGNGRKSLRFAFFATGSFQPGRTPKTKSAETSRHS